MSSTLTPIAIDFSKVEAVIGSKDESLIDLLLRKYQAEIDEVDELAEELEEDEPDDEAEDDEASRRASLLALSQLLGKAKASLEGGQPLNQALAGLDQNTGVSTKHADALRDLLSDARTNAQHKTDDQQQAYASTADVLRHLVTGDAPTRKVAFKFMYGHAYLYLCQHLGEELPHDNWHDLRGSSWAKTLDKALKSTGVPTKTLSVSKHLVDRGSPLKQIPKYSDSPSIGYLTLLEVELALTALREANRDSLDEETKGFLADVQEWLQTCAQKQCGLICFGV